MSTVYQLAKRSLAWPSCRQRSMHNSETTIQSTTLLRLPSNLAGSATLPLWNLTRTRLSALRSVTLLVSSYGAFCALESCSSLGAPARLSAGRTIAGQRPNSAQSARLLLTAHLSAKRLHPRSSLAPPSPHPPPLSIHPFTPRLWPLLLMSAWIPILPR